MSDVLDQTSKHTNTKIYLAPSATMRSKYDPYQLPTGGLRSYIDAFIKPSTSSKGTVSNRKRKTTPRAATDNSKKKVNAPMHNKTNKQRTITTIIPVTPSPNKNRKPESTSANPMKSFQINAKVTPSPQKHLESATNHDNNNRTFTTAATVSPTKGVYDKDTYVNKEIKWRLRSLSTSIDKYLHTLSKERKISVLNLPTLLSDDFRHIIMEIQNAAFMASLGTTEAMSSQNLDSLILRFRHEKKMFETIKHIT
jgi:hypothetical protein